jgi:hypothetical protein
MEHMSKDDPEALAARYSKWDTAELIRAVELEADGYRPEALALMRRELDRRDVNVETRNIAREDEVENDRRHYVGVRGWLTFLAVVVALSSVMALTSAAQALRPSLHPVLLYLVVFKGLMGLYGLVVVGLIVLRHRAAPRHATIVVALFWLNAVAGVTLFTPVTGGRFLRFAFWSAWLVIWWSYSHSKRIRMTFQPESDWYDEPRTQERAPAGIDEFRASDRLGRDEIHNRAIR